MTIAVAIAAAVGVAAALDASVIARESGDADGLIERVVTQASRSGIAIRAIRELRAGTVSGKHLGWMTVETSVTPAGAFLWKVVEEGGSERTRDKVFHELLKKEAAAWRSGERDGAALTPDNYQLAPIASSPAGELQLRLIPRRQDAKLIDGVLTVNADGSPIRLEGKLAKSPSFWVKSVTIVKHYSRVGGVALPTSLESLADLKMFGRSTFTMRYRYSEVNGRSVPHAAALAPFVGPSAEILAIHGSATER